MKNLFTNLGLGKLSISKVILSVLALGAVLVLVSIVMSVLSTLSGSTREGVSGLTADFASSKQDLAMRNAMDFAYEEEMAPSSVSMPYGDDSGGVGAYDEEEYEALSYYAQIKTSELEQVCDIVEGWKPQPYIVFETARRNDHNCSYQFKVERMYAEDIAAAVAVLQPNEFTAQTETVKKQLVEFDSRLSILLQKEQLISDTLKDATAAFDEVLALATDIEDADTLSKVVNNKLAAIERLTQQRIALAQQIDALARRAAELADDVDFVQFVVSVEKYEVFDLDSIKDSWVYAMRSFTYNLNQTFQSLTLGLLLNLLLLAQLVLYALILLFLVKYGWQFVKTFWSGGTVTPNVADTPVVVEKITKAVAQTKSRKKKTTKK